MDTKKLYVILILTLPISLVVLFYNVTEGEPGKKSFPLSQETTGSTDIALADQKSNNCLTCHSGLESIRDPESGMMQEIRKMAERSGFMDNECIVCHGGDPEAVERHQAHRGTIAYFLENGGPAEFFPNPASVWINIRTCGMCHKEQVSTQYTSLMFTEAGKIQGTTWGFGGLQGYDHNVANVGVKELDYHQRLGSEVYKKYMDKLKDTEPQIFPGEMTPLPPSPDPAELVSNPALSVYTYLRTECQRCHTGVKGQRAHADYRGSGCASCHIPYSNKGLYEGMDPAINKSIPGKMLVHSIQSSRDVRVNVNGHSYSGVPTKTCTSCHNRGRRIGVSYEGIMETSYAAPFMSNVENQQKIHKKNYLHLKADLHLSKGMFCQDCHTSGDLHSLGDLSGAIQGAVEIECQDCHGTPSSYPWELPFGYGDEIATQAPAKGDPRGVSQTVPEYLYKGSVDSARDGYLFSSRGNPMPHIVKQGNQVIVHTAGGRDLHLKPLRLLTEKDNLSQKAKISMSQVTCHIDKMECYTCHATWAPQCYGCHIKIDYSRPESHIDWVEMARNPGKNGLTPDAGSHESIMDSGRYLIQGKVEEQRSFLRWENPILAVNGDHRISPAVPGCQTTITIKNRDGEVILLNHIYRIPDAEGAGLQGQLATDMAPLQPHTMQKNARDCESCHGNPKAMGYGMDQGKIFYPPDTNFVLDLLDAEGNVIASQVDTHFNAIPNLHMDWSRIIDEDNNQLQTVGHHLSGSRPLNKDELMKLDRRGVCISCHQSIPDQDLAVSLMSHVGEFAGMEIDNETHSGILHKNLRFSAWIQLILPILFLVGIILWLSGKRLFRGK